MLRLARGVGVAEGHQDQLMDSSMDDHIPGHESEVEQFDPHLTVLTGECANILTDSVYPLGRRVTRQSQELAKHTSPVEKRNIPYLRV
jgi:hypothetical protein